MCFNRVDQVDMKKDNITVVYGQTSERETHSGLLCHVTKADGNVPGKKTYRTLHRTKLMLKHNLDEGEAFPFVLPFKNQDPQYEPKAVGKSRKIKTIMTKSSKDTDKASGKPKAYSVQDRQAIKTAKKYKAKRAEFSLIAKHHNEIYDKYGPAIESFHQSTQIHHADYVLAVLSNKVNRMHTGDEIVALEQKC